jgi:hypothetical protein
MEGAQSVPVKIRSRFRQIQPRRFRPAKAFSLRVLAAAWNGNRPWRRQADGTFTIGPVRAGEYVVAAVTGLSMSRLFEPSARAEIAERIVKVGERIVLVENDKHAVDLRITKVQ